VQAFLLGELNPSGKHHHGNRREAGADCRRLPPAAGCVIGIYFLTTALKTVSGITAWGNLNLGDPLGRVAVQHKQLAGASRGLVVVR